MTQWIGVLLTICAWFPTFECAGAKVNTLRLWSVPKCWCPDDYCSKYLPFVRAAPRGCVDDYCRKPLPPTPRCCRGFHDDYLRKCMPCFIGEMCSPWHQCHPTR